MKRNIYIDAKNYLITGDTDYLGTRGEHFEPATTHLFQCFCEQHFQVLDVGANIGLTTIALANICNTGKVVAIEPIPRAFQFLEENITNAALKNVKIVNFAVGENDSRVMMQGKDDFLAGSFIAERYQADSEHFSITIPMKPLDEIFDSSEIERVDFIKMDLEGYELFALAGARNILKQFKPMVYLEMNHWCLNVFHRISLPEFHERLLDFFPYIFCIDGDSYLDFSESRNFHHIAHEHLIKLKYCNLIAGFDRAEILNRLTQLKNHLSLL
ncbi:FkbM family methyltransferase [Rickettsiella endosymbiont of Dermanyssus gallinae]|uniref:FkbM family methyltransferase n=1 Tax=Rickettsiella endosymbiont of Dermanyssus gallinae TaxID=2856608 RepID=UPI001C527C73|nr:FkbM family methyltransferase [Rickettsiella endosymbiont of Dermanyssus gallinae]